MPERGKPLDAVLSVPTDYRCMVYERYRVFYLWDGARIEIVRVLHNLQDYMRALFDAPPPEIKRHILLSTATGAIMSLFATQEDTV